MRPGQQTNAMRRWIMALEYNDIRRAESIRHRVARPDGRPLRGVFVTPRWCLGRDKLWYYVDGRTRRATPTASVIALQRFTLPQLQVLFFMAGRRQRLAHCRQP